MNNIKYPSHTLIEMGYSLDNAVRSDLVVNDTSGF
jgi:hypothetical protein